MSRFHPLLPSAQETSPASFPSWHESGRYVPALSRFATRFDDFMMTSFSLVYIILYGKPKRKPSNKLVYNVYIMRYSTSNCNTSMQCTRFESMKNIDDIDVHFSRLHSSKRSWNLLPDPLGQFHRRQKTPSACGRSEHSQGDRIVLVVRIPQFLTFERHVFLENLLVPNVPL